MTGQHRPQSVLVAGGAGGVGAGIVRAWLSVGATVVTLSRDAARLDALHESAASLAGDLVAMHGSAQDAEILHELADDYGPFDQVAASIGGGGWRMAAIRTLGHADVQRIVDDGIVAHWVTSAALRPRVRENGSYIFINGGAAHAVVRGAGALTLVARSQLALAEIFDAEESPRRIRTVSLILNSPIATPARGASVRPQWLTPDDVGRACVALARGSYGATGAEVVSVRSREDVAAL